MGRRAAFAPRSLAWESSARVAAGVLASLAAVLASASVIPFAHLSEADGLSQPAVQAILQDRHGFVWLGTQEGLDRWDGHEMLVYRHEPHDPRSLPNNWIWTLAEDRDGRLWVGTDGGGLARLNADGTFTRFEHDPSEPASLPSNVVRDLEIDVSGMLWIGTDGGGVARMDPATGSLARLDILVQGEARPDDRVRDLHFDADGRLWMGTDGGGVECFDPANGRVSRLGDRSNVLPDRVRTVAARGDVLWIGSYEDGLVRYDLRSGQVRSFVHEPGRAGSLSGNSVRTVLLDEQGTLWVGTDGGGLNRFDPEREWFESHRHTAGDPASLIDDHVVALRQDRGGVIWVGTYAGVSRFNPLIGSFVTVRRRSTASDELSNDYVTSFVEDADGAIWIGTYGGGLNRWDPGRTAFTHYRHEPDDPRSLSDDRVFALATAPGTLWIGTRGGGLNRLDTATGRMTHYRADGGRADALAADGVTSLLLDARGRLWVGTYLGGLSRLDDPERDAFVTYRVSSHGLCSDRVLALLEDSRGTVWVGTHGGGICRYEPQTDGFVGYRHDPRDETSLSSDRAWALMEDGRGDLWVSTQDGGLNRLRGADRTALVPRFARYGLDVLDKGNARFAVYGALADAAGAIWFSTNRGLGRLDPETGTVRMFDVTHGLQGNDFGHGALARTRAGELLFGGVKGFNVFDPLSISVNERPPLLAFTRITRLGHAIPLDVTKAGSPPLEFDHRDVLIGFEYAALDYTAPQRNRYRHRLVGFDDAWVDDGRNRSVTYTNLAAGAYRFEVLAANNDGVWTPSPLTLSFEVLPAPWATAWARTGYALAALLAMFIVFRSAARRAAVARQISETNAALRREIDERLAQERALVRAKEQAQLYLDVVEVIIVSIDPDDRIQVINQKGTRVLGYGEVELIGEDFYQRLVPAAARDEVRARFRAVGVNGYSESLVVTRDGTERLIAWHVAQLPPAADGRAGVLVSGADVTQMRSLEAQVREAQKMEALGTLSRGIAHDFNNILAAILGFSELSRAELPPRSKAVNYLDRLDLSVKRARNLVQSILTFGRQGRGPVSPTRVQGVVHEALQLLRATLPGNIELRTRIDNLADPVMADPSQLHQVVMNLATNAFHALQEKGGVLTIEVAPVDVDVEAARSRPQLGPGRYVALLVEDTGVGMDDVTRARMFEPFFTTKGPGHGSGLGLSVVHGIVTQMGGTIDVESRLGEGTCVRVLMPAAQPESDVAREQPREPAALPRGDETIVFVDDEPAIVSIAREMFAMLGYALVTALDASQALKELERRDGAVDLLITDQTMPGTFGLELARTVHARYPNLPVILMSGAHDPDLDEPAVSALLAKPFTLEELARTVRATLDRAARARV